MDWDISANTVMIIEIKMAPIAERKTRSVKNLLRVGLKKPPAIPPIATTRAIFQLIVWTTDFPAIPNKDIMAPENVVVPIVFRIATVKIVIYPGRVYNLF